MWHQTCEKPNDERVSVSSRDLRGMDRPERVGVAEVRRLDVIEWFVCELAQYGEVKDR